MTSIEELAARRHSAFQSARLVVEEWRASGRRTTTAGVTSALRASGVLDLADLEMTSNREFWDLAVQSGLLARVQQPNGHPLLLLPGEVLADFVPAPSQVETSVVGPETRLKNDVWNSFVDWNQAYRRFWDRQHARAFMIPSAPGWGPAEVDTDRFVEIVPPRQAIAVGWMREFSASMPEPTRAALQTSLGDEAPRGAFRREVRERGLHQAWRAALRSHILDVATTWATAAGVEVSTILDTRTRASDAHRDRVATSNLPAMVAGQPLVTADRRGSKSTQPTQAGLPVGPEGSTLASSDDSDRTRILRARLHRVIEAMAWDELADLPLRAEHLTLF